MSDVTRLTDLAAARLGGMVLAASDEFFAPSDNLLRPQPPTFDPLRYTDRGKHMDGWETRRRRDGGHDWCVVRLGAPGIVRGVVVDTSFFRGNAPQACALEGCAADGALTAAALAGVEWFPLLARTPLQPDTVHTFPVHSGLRVTHVRLTIVPDGGVARLRLHGQVLPDLRRSAGPRGWLDLTAVVNGGAVTACSDMFFSSPHHLIDPGDARDMADGWETRRRRGTGHDWVIVRLAAHGVVERVEIDTTHFKGNHPDSCALAVCDAGPVAAPPPASAWQEVMGPTPLGPHVRHTFAVRAAPPATHARLAIFPDGGVARLRLFGSVTADGWRRAGVRWLDALPEAAFVAEVTACCASQGWARRLAAARPFGDFDALLAAADDAWAACDPADWLEAFAAHPRIGERAGGWSRGEQAAAAQAPQATLDALAEANHAYEQRFGHVFLVCAAGRSADELLAALRERLRNEPQAELRVAAEEQRKITRLRLDKLVHPAGDDR